MTSFIPEPANQFAKILDTTMQHFKQELIDYPDYYNNRRIKAKLKGLPPEIHRQLALSAA